MEPVLVGLGVVVCKWAIRTWADEDAALDLSASLLDFVPKSVGNLLLRKNTGRQLDQVADDIARRIQSILSGDLRGADEGEATAAVAAVMGSIEKIAGDTGALLGLDLDLAKVEDRVRAGDPNAIKSAGLGDVGEAIYNTVLSECVSYVVTILGKLPDFGVRATSELLQRSTGLSDLIEHVLDQLPASSVPHAWGSGSASEVFETIYRRTIYLHADNVKLFGVSSSYASSEYSLSVAYISLSLQLAKGSPTPNESNLHRAHSKKLKGTRRSVSESDAPVRIEQALGGLSRLLLAGNAGNGKTTLVQWLAATAAQGRFDAEMDDWNGLVPFMVPLRRYVGQPLPKPEDLLEHSAQNLIGAMPQGWVHGVLAAGRGILLVDGMDELPEDERAGVTDWINQLLRDFPKNKFVVTSRTTALDGRWNDLPSFHLAELQPMEYSDIKLFVSHWHRALLARSAREEESSIRKSQEALLSAVRESPAIRALCTSPLLCALVCALNRERGGRLPESRMDIYETALSMLVQRRDTERGIVVGLDAQLTYKEAIILLRSFAVWMHENGKADTDRGTFETRIERALPSLHNVKVTAGAVAQHLIVRSGVLREPESNRVDFVHRTFLEYLAAGEIVEDNSIPKLIQHAHEDHWREVVIMAAGHAQRTARTELLLGLIERGDKEEENRHKLYLLAVACMETSPDLSPDVQTELSRCLAAVVPPKSMSDATAVASAGPLAVPLLSQYRFDLATTVAACVRSLAIIGGDAAMGALANYRTDKRVTVARQLIRAWSSFDTEAYAREILAFSPLDQGFVNVTDPDQLDALKYLTNLQVCWVDVSGKIESLREIPPEKAIRTLAVGGTADMDLSLLPANELSGVHELYVGGSQNIVSLRGLESFRSLSILDASYSPSLTDISSIASFQTLGRVSLSGTGIKSTKGLGETVISNLTLLSCHSLDDLGEAVPASYLHIDARHGMDLTGISNSSILEHLVMYGVENGSKLALPESLRIFDYWQSGGTGVALTGGRNLTRVELSGGPIETNLIDFVVNLPNVAEVEISAYSIGDEVFDATLEIAKNKSVREISLRLFDPDLSPPYIEGFRKKAIFAGVQFVREE